MPKHPSCPQVYEVMEQFKNRCLLNTNSLLWEESDVWTIDALEQINKNFMHNPIEGDKFWNKLEKQFTGLPKECIKILADSFIIYSLPSTFMKPSKKWGFVEKTCDIHSLEYPAKTTLIEEALSQGFSRTSQRYHFKYMQLWLLLTFALELKKSTTPNKILNDPDSLNDLLNECLSKFPKGDRAYDIRHALLHMLFPENYERIISTRDKEDIVKFYGDYLPSEKEDINVDEQISIIRNELEDRYGKPFDFYQSGIKQAWRQNDDDSIKTEIKDDSSPTDLRLEELAQPLLRDKNLILYGPPGTGKTYYALELAKAIIATDHFEKDISELSDHELQSIQLENLIEQDSKYWWCVASPSIWSWDAFNSKTTIDFKFGRIQQNFEEASVGDIVFGYESTPTLSLKAVAQIKRPLHKTESGMHITLEKVHTLEKPIPYDEIKNHEILKHSQPVKFSNRGTLFSLGNAEAEILLNIINEHNPDFTTDINFKDSSTPYLRMCTFHPAYGYEEFIEGYRPALTEDGQSYFQIKDGIFKRICNDARQEPDRTFVLVIDEINRGNIPQIFGELITTLESDKRWNPRAPIETGVVLPISNEPFAVPDNVLVIGTMNTADKSIALLDTALRRRFAFRELLPETELLTTTIYDINLGEFLETINDRISRIIERNLQIGHAYFMKKGTPISSKKELYDVLRDKIFPLLQDYCYGDYQRLEEILGNDIIDSENKRFNQEYLQSGNEEKLLYAMKNIISS